MNRFEEGDRVRIDIPDEGDPDFEEFHGREGTIVAVLEDQAANVTGDDRDSRLYRIELKGDVTFDARWRDLRPPL